MLSIIVPCYNEADAIPHFFAATEAVVQDLDFPAEYIFVKQRDRKSVV